MKKDNIKQDNIKKTEVDKTIRLGGKCNLY